MHPTAQGGQRQTRVTTLFRLALLAALMLGSFMALTEGAGNNAVQLMGDKLIHFLGAAMLGFLCDYSFPGPRSNYWRWQAPLLLGYGILIEVVQGFMPHRVADHLDVIANAAGLLAYGGLRALVRTLGQRHE